MPVYNEIRDVLNRYSRENESNTPDFILAEYLMDCLKAFEKATNERDKFYGQDESKPGHLITGYMGDVSPLGCDATTP